MPDERETTDIDWRQVKELTRGRQKRWEDWQAKKAREHYGRKAAFQNTLPTAVTLGYTITYEELDKALEDL